MIEPGKVTYPKLPVSTFAGAALMFSALLACNQGLERVPEASVDATKKALAEKLGTKLQSSCNTGKFEALGEEATAAMKEGLNSRRAPSDHARHWGHSESLAAGVLASVPVTSAGLVTMALSIGFIHGWDSH